MDLDLDKKINKNYKSKLLTCRNAKVLTSVITKPLPHERPTASAISKALYLSPQTIEIL